MTTTKVIVDTDPGKDDALALLLLLASPEISVEAVTTVAGNSSIQNVTNNAAFITALAGRADVPIFSGADRPLKREPVFAVVHGKSGMEGVNVPHNVVLDGRAVDEIIAHIAGAPDEITLLVLGPQTNIARAIKRAPETMRRVKKIVMMGGAFAVPGNKNAVAEFNIGVDPEAAAIVASFPVDKVYVPLDVCNQVQIPLDCFEAIASPSIRDTLVAMMRPYIVKLNREELPTDGALMYDVLAAYSLLESAKCTYQSANVQIETKGELTYGMTLIDGRMSRQNDQPNARIMTSLDKTDFTETFFTAMNTWRV